MTVSCVAYATTPGNGRRADAQMLPLGALLSFTLPASDPDAREEKMLFPPGRSFRLQDSEQRMLSQGASYLMSLETYQWVNFPREMSLPPVIALSLPMILLPSPDTHQTSGIM